MGGIDWLPELLLFKDYGNDWDRYLDVAYEHFTRDFIIDMPSLLDKPVKSNRYVPYNGKDHSFWHCIEEREKGTPRSEENRIPKISLIERIRWPRPIIEHIIQSANVLAWSEIHRGHGTKRRVHLFLKDEDYVVVLDPRGEEESGKPSYYFLWTTFLCYGPRQHLQLLKRYEESKDKIN